MRFRLVIFFLVLTFHSYSRLISTMIAPSLDRVIRLGAIGADALLILLALTALWRNRSSFSVKYFALFLFFSTLSYIYNIERFGFIEHLNGMRDPLSFFVSLIVVNDLFESPQRTRLIKYFTLFMVILALAQTPASFFQFLKYGAGDRVGGTYGIEGGSGYVTQMLFLIVFYFVVRYASLEGGTHFSVLRTSLFLPLFIPCLLNETKVTFILLPVFLILLLSSRRRFYKAAPFLVLGAIIGYLAYYYYYMNLEENVNIFDPVYIEKYLLTNPTGYGGDLPRFQRLVLLFHMVKGDIGWILLGMGFGIIGGGSVIQSSRLGRSLYYMVTGSRILLFRTLIQGGILGTVVVAGAIFAWFQTKADLPHTVRQFRWFVVASILVIWFYDEAAYDKVFAPILAYMMFWIRSGGIAGETIEEPLTGEELLAEGEALE